MRKITLLLLSMCISVSAWSQGIVFETGTWNDVLEKAKKTGKPILLDIYATWCEPCKTMNDYIFVQEKVGTFYNKEFINYRIDGEKGEGIALISRFRLTAYPTYLFFRPDGTQIAKTMGYMFGEQFISFGKSVLPMVADKRSLDDVEKQYRKDKTNPDVVYDLICYRAVNGVALDDVFDFYLKALPESQRYSEKVASIYRMLKTKININSFACDNLVKYQNELTPLLDRKAEFYLKDISMMAMSQAANNRDLKLLDKAIVAYGEDPPTPKNYLKEYFYMGYYVTNHDAKNFTVYARRYYNEYLMGMTPDSKVISGNTIATLFSKGTSFVLKECNDPVLLKEAVSWTKRAIEVAPNNKAARYTLCNLMYKSGDSAGGKAGLTKLIQEFSDPNDATAKTYRETLKKMYANQPTW